MEQASGKQSSSTDSSLPVLVFFHGGGMVGGSKDGWLPQWMFSELSLICCSSLATTDVALVTEDALDAGFAVVRLLSPCIEAQRY